MKHRIFLFLAILLSTGSIAQPQGINYQGIARDSVGHPLINQSISLRLSILDSSASCQVVYVEIQNALTYNSGLFNLSIGNGVATTGVFANINWGQNNKWLKVEMDVSGASNFLLIGVTQFLSVPYALHANTADSISSHPLTIQERLNNGESPKHIYDSGVPQYFLLGKFYQGGLISSIDLATGHGFIVTPFDLSISCSWNNGSNFSTNATGIAEGTGQSNTSLIVTLQGVGNYAAYLCDTLNLNGYSDWFLPSLAELNTLASLQGIVNFIITNYWSSSENDQYSSHCVFFSSGEQFRPKTELHGVRAFRTF